MSTPPYISVIIPALNEEETITGVVSGLWANGVSAVVVVDNGSTDKTRALAASAGALVVTESQRGYGKACLTGIENLPPETEWVLFCDADGSDDLSELGQYWERLEEFDFLIGNRRATKDGRANLTPVQNFGNWLSGGLMKLGWGRGFSDLGPLRAIRKHSLDALKMQDENFGWTVEMQAKSLESNLRTCEIPVNYLPRQGGTSKISGNLVASAQAGRIILTTIGQLWLRRPSVQRLLQHAALMLLVFGAALTSLGNPESMFTYFVFGMGVMVLGYVMALGIRSASLLLVFGVALMVRLILLPMPPGDDVWRYIWEGLVQIQGVNPYNVPPDSEALLALRPDWWGRINHPEVTAIYPPLTQLIFQLLAWISPSVLAFKLVIVTADLGVGVLLWRRFGPSALLYLFNPLVIYCGAGGGHYDPLFLLPLVAAWLLWERSGGGIGKAISLGILLGCSVMLKFVALFAAGYVGWVYCLQSIRKRGYSSFVRLLAYSLSLVIVPVGSYILFSLLLGQPDSLFPERFADTARSASLIPWVAEFFNEHPYKVIPNSSFVKYLLGLLVLVLISARSFAGFQTRSFLTLFAFSPMIHAWYFTWLVPFALMRYRVTIVLLTISGMIYFLLPYRQCLQGEWLIYPVERLLLWSPYLLLLGLLAVSGWRVVRAILLRRVEGR